MLNEINNINNNLFGKIILTLGVVLRLFGFVIVGAYLSGLFLSLITGVELIEFNRVIFDMEERTEARFFLLLMQGLNSLIVYFVLPSLYIFFFQKDLKKIFLIRKKKLGGFILISLFIFIAALPFISKLIEFNQQIQLSERLSNLQELLLRMEEQAQKVTDLIVFYDNWYEIIPILFVVAVLAGIGEELLFRGVIQNEIYRIYKNPHIAVWISAILFSFVHFQFQGFLPRMVLGGLLGYLYYWSSSLLTPVLLHFLNNVLTFFLLNYEERQDEAILSTSFSFELTMISTIICIILIIACYRLYLKVKGMTFE